MSGRRLVCRIRLWWAERVVDRPFSAEASYRIDAALLARETAQ